MPAQGACLYNAQTDTGMLTPQQIGRLKDFGLSFMLRINNPTLDYNSFAKVMMAEEGPAVAGHIPALWQHAKSAYERDFSGNPAVRMPNGDRYPPIKATVQEHLPTYAEVYAGQNDFETSYARGLRNLMESGIVSANAVRDVRPGNTSKSIAESKARARAILDAIDKDGGGKVTPDVLRMRNAKPDEIIAAMGMALKNYRDEFVQANNDYTAAKGAVDALNAKKGADPETLAQAVGEMQEAFARMSANGALYDYTDALLRGEKTGYARALRMMRELQSIRRRGGDRLKDFSEMFGDGPDNRSKTVLTRRDRDGNVREMSDSEAEAAARVSADTVLGKGRNRISSTSARREILEKSSGVLVHTDYAKGLIERVNNTYTPPMDGRNNAEVIASLREIGLYVYKFYEGDRDFASWSVKMMAVLGQRIDPKDLVEAYKAMRPAAWDKVRAGRDLQRIAMRKLMQSGAVAQMEEAADKIRAIDPQAPDATDRYNEVLNKYRDDQPVNFYDDATGLWRAVKTAWDMSAPGRQAALITIGWGLNPASLWDAGAKRRQGIVGKRLLDMMAAKGDNWLSFAKSLGLKTSLLSSEEYAKAVMNDINTRRNAELYDRFGLPLTKIGDDIDIHDREEAFMSNLVRRWKRDGNVYQKYIADGIEGSENAYATYLNGIRADAFDLMTEVYVADGYTPDTHPDLYRATAKYIGDMTGRADLSGDDDKNRRMSDPASFLSRVFFAPRFQWSRAKTAFVVPRAVFSEVADRALKSSDPKVRALAYNLREKGHVADMPEQLRKQVYGDFARYMGAYAVLASLAVMAGGEIDTDPRSSDFMNIKMGKTRVDLLGGMQGWYRILATLPTNSSVNRETRELQKLGGAGAKGAQGWDATVTRFFLTKLAPTPSLAVEFIRGIDAAGQNAPLSIRRRPTNPQEYAELGKKTFFNVVPLGLKDYYEGWEKGGMFGLSMSALNYFGIKASTWDEEFTQNVEGEGAPTGTPLPVLRR